MSLRAHRLCWLLLALGLGLLPAGCHDSPSKVVKKLGDHAERRKLIPFRDSFSLKAQEALQRQFREDGLSDAEGWRDLMAGYLGKDREPPEVVGEVREGDNAVVKVSKEIKPRKGSRAPPKTIVQELALVKQDKDWKLALGPMKYEVKAEKKKDDKKAKKEKPLADDQEELQLGGKKDKKAKKVEDIDLEEF